MKSTREFDPDSRVTAILKKRYAFQSRRSFLHRASAAIFGILGVTLVRMVPLFTVPKAKAAHACSDNGSSGTATWERCGLNSTRICDANCTIVGGSSWVLCCRDTTDCQLYHPCTYTDLCTADGQTPPGCDWSSSGLPSSGDQWCSGGSIACTKYSCSSPGYQSLSACNQAIGI